MLLCLRNVINVSNLCQVLCLRNVINVSNLCAFMFEECYYCFQLNLNIDSIHYLGLTNSFDQVP